MSLDREEKPGTSTVYDETRLDFKKAMADFHTMFPELDQEVIEVLKH